MRRLLSWVWGFAVLGTFACGNTRVEREPHADAAQTPDDDPTSDAGGPRTDGNPPPDSDLPPDGDPKAPPAQASLFFVIGPPGVPGPGCAIGNYAENIGGPPSSAGADPGAREIDGVSDARISCRIAGSTSFEVSGSAEKGAVSFRLMEGKIASSEGTGTVSVAGPGTAGKQLTSATDACRLSVSRPPYQVASGAIWAEFDCPLVTTPADPGSTCSARGEFVFENCER